MKSVLILLKVPNPFLGAFYLQLFKSKCFICICSQYSLGFNTNKQQLTSTAASLCEMKKENGILQN